MWVGRRTVAVMRSLFRLSAVLPVLALAAACGDDGGSASETSTSSTSSSASETSASSVGASTTSGSTTPGTSPGTDTTTSTTATDSTDATLAGTTDASETSDASTGEPSDPPPPTDAATLLPWLEAGNYARWDAEAERHPSEGPHFDGVRTFVNSVLLESLEAGGDDHPVGSSVVKELYGAGPEVGGWAVMVKVAAGSSVDNWYWYESFQGTTYADATGVGGCGDCHTMGTDFIRTTLPL